MADERSDKGNTGKLIDLIYAAMLGEESWQRFLDALVTDVPAGKAAMQMFNVQRPSESGVVLQAGFEASAIKAYGAHYCAFNMLQKSLGLRNDGVGYADSQLVPLDRLRSGEFFNDWLRPNDILSSSGVKMGAEGAWNFSLTLMSDQEDEVLSRRMVHRLTSLAPHLHRAARFYHRQANVAPGSVEARLLDTTPSGVIVIGREVSIKAMNPYAETFLRLGPFPFKVRRGRLDIQDDALADLVQAMLALGYNGPETVTRALPGVRITLIRMAREGISLLFQGVSLIMLIDSLDIPSSFDEEVFALEYHLTPAEVRAARGIVSGLTPAEIAQQVGLSRETIRVQIRSLYAKTGAKNQADILRLAKLRLTH